jgi:hypothetical protein
MKQKNNLLPMRAAELLKAAGPVTIRPLGDIDMTPEN